MKAVSFLRIVGKGILDVLRILETARGNSAFVTIKRTWEGLYDTKAYAPRYDNVAPTRKIRFLAFGAGGVGEITRQKRTTFQA